MAGVLNPLARVWGCVDCGKIIDCGTRRIKRASQRCPPCHYAFIKSRALIRVRRCGDCGKPLPLGSQWKGNTRCRACSHAWRRSLPYQCLLHGHVPFYFNGHPRRRRCIQCTHEQSYRARALLRQQAIQAYGAVCACCGEKELVFLNLDHVNGDGAAHRRVVGTGREFHQWLKVRGYPKKEFQLLCANCNTGKYRMGICPHQSQPVESARQ